MFEWLGGWLVARETPILLGTGVVVAWCAAEYTARRATWRLGAPKRPSSAIDRGTYPVIALGLGVSLLVDLVAFVFGWGGALPDWVSFVGVAVAALGLGIRGWALRTLGRFFTMPITLAPDHQIVRAGPYRWLRHPAYTGGFLTAISVPLALGNGVAFLVALAACAAVYGYRIPIEEAALVRRFGDAYREYASHTSRLVPGVY